VIAHTQSNRWSTRLDCVCAITWLIFTTLLGNEKFCRRTLRSAWNS